MLLLLLLLPVHRYTNCNAIPNLLPSWLSRAECAPFALFSQTMQT